MMVRQRRPLLPRYKSTYMGILQGEVDLSKTYEPLQVIFSQHTHLRPTMQVSYIVVPQHVAHIRGQLVRRCQMLLT